LKKGRVFYEKKEKKYKKWYSYISLSPEQMADHKGKFVYFLFPPLTTRGVGELGDPLLRLNKTSFIETGSQYNKFTSWF
jgi:hypothetical protein